MLTDLDRVRAAMVRAAEVSNAEVREVAFHRFEPHGVSGVVVIAESHLSIHTWPELGYAAIDIYTCGSEADPWIGMQYLIKQFGCSTVTTSVIHRGTLSDPGSYSHVVAAFDVEDQLVSQSA